MANTAEFGDTSIYELVHQILARTPGRDRREHMRQPFPAIHRIAPWRGDGLSYDGGFVEVECHDLTQGGFSFFLPDAPAFSVVVAEFTGPRQSLKVLARVAHVRRVLAPPSAAVMPMREFAGVGYSTPSRTSGPVYRFLVGCQFIRRLRPGESGEVLDLDGDCTV